MLEDDLFGEGFRIIISIVLMLFPILMLIKFFKMLYNKNTFAFYGVIAIIIIFIVGTIYFVCKKEYTRIKNKDMISVKATLTRFLRAKYSKSSNINDFFVLVEDEKNVSKRTLLKRCFKSYQVDLKAFIPSGELLCSVTVSGDKVDIDEIKQVSNVNFAKEFYKK
ncbi:hypothetical protein SIM22_04755 [Bacillus cereus group sp. BfR-BA-01363]|uniref:hypothetical protein n=1 Tax=Bacillus cereus group sp. BfR-BA-01363 TaxID=3094882 RepID=UPI0029C54B3A|nr:hypothetical protein [Bacillus cereus group sp. BfR-BA-01363]MDX5853440.1 hypothetical protein [Bacillus cereus group sp. BfR-BA-01363]